MDSHDDNYPAISGNGPPKHKFTDVFFPLQFLSKRITLTNVRGLITTSEKIVEQFDWVFIFLFNFF